VEEMYADDYIESEINNLFNLLRTGKQIDTTQSRKIKSALLKSFAEWNCKKNWVQQFHIGPIRNNNSRMFQQLGADTGWDSMGGAVNPKLSVVFWIIWIKTIGWQRPFCTASIPPITKC